jgi:hypothetical protein
VIDYGWVLKRAWEITWKFKSLWVLGILASCSSGGGGGGSGGGGSGSSYQFNGETDRRFLEFERWLRSIPEETWITIAIVVGVAVLLLSVVALVLGILGQAGLIAGFHQVEPNGSVTLGEAWRIGRANFWRLLGVRIIFWLAGILAAILLVAMAVPAILGTMGIGFICLIPLLCVLVPVGVLVGVYVMLTQVALVTEALEVKEAFRRSWEIFRSNLGPVILVALIVIFGSLVIQLVLALPLIAAVVPALAGLAFGTDQSSTTGLVTAGVCLAVYLPLLIVANGILQTYVSGVWTLSWRQWTGRAKGEPALPAVVPPAA